MPGSTCSGRQVPVDVDVWQRGLGSPQRGFFTYSQPNQSAKACSAPSPVLPAWPPGCQEYWTLEEQQWSSGVATGVGWSTWPRLSPPYRRTRPEAWGARAQASPGVIACHLPTASASHFPTRMEMTEVGQTCMEVETGKRPTAVTSSNPDWHDFGQITLVLLPNPN